MDALGNGGFFWLNFPPKNPHRHRSRRHKSSSSSSSSSPSSFESINFSNFPLKQSVIASALSLTGDTIAQLRDRFLKIRRLGGDDDAKDNASVILLDHDWLRSLRMASYGFLLYGPGSYAWYKLLDRCMPNPTVINLSMKVLLNQIVLGPCVIAVVFAWNNLWLGKLSDLPTKYRRDALPTLFYGFRFWVPVSILNFGVVPLSSRVAFMSTAAIFWNYYLSSTLSR